MGDQPATLAKRSCQARKGPAPPLELVPLRFCNRCICSCDGALIDRFPLIMTIDCRTDVPRDLGVCQCVGYQAGVLGITLGERTGRRSGRVIAKHVDQLEGARLQDVVDGTTERGWLKAERRGGWHWAVARNGDFEKYRSASCRFCRTGVGERWIRDRCARWGWCWA